MKVLPIDTVYHDEDESIYPTLNGMGFSYTDLTYIGEAFVQWSKDQEAAALDIGAAYGFATRKVLEKGASVIANDLFAQHLDILYHQTPPELRSRLGLLPGRFPEEVDLPANCLSSVFASNILHFLDDVQIGQALQKIYKWLKPGGKVFGVVMTPYSGYLEKIIPIYEARKARGHFWPGVFLKSSLYNSKKGVEVVIPEKMHFFDRGVLHRAFQEASFKIDHLEYISRQKWPLEWQYDGRESIGIIGIKPL